MWFFERGSVGNINNFTQNDLLQYVESLMKESSVHEPTAGNYSWLKSRNTQHDYSQDLEGFKPMLSKMSSESCASIAVKLDTLSEVNLTTTAVLANFERLLLEQYSMQVLGESVTRAKNRKGNRVHPDLGERQPVVSFILD